MTFKKVFLDANILIDVFDDKRDSFHDSKKIYKHLYKNDILIYTSCDIATTIYYFTVKSADSDKALNAMQIINQTINILPFENKDLQKTITLMQDDSDYIDLEDTLQYIIAKESGCEVIISNDKNFTAKELPLFTPKKFVDRYI
jgi:predicted nucleic acid-binding protein